MDLRCSLFMCCLKFLSLMSDAFLKGMVKSNEFTFNIVNHGLTLTSKAIHLFFQIDWLC